MLKSSSAALEALYQTSSSVSAWSAAHNFQSLTPAPADGVVNAIGQDYIGVLVLGIFNAAIGRAQIPTHIQCRPLVLLVSFVVP